MPIYQPSLLIGAAISFIEKEGDYGPQLEAEIEPLGGDGEVKNRMLWLPVGKQGVTARSVLGKWIEVAAECDKRIDNLDFSRVKNGSNMGIKGLIDIVKDTYYLWEDREIKYPGGSKERLVPVRKFKDQAAAQEEYDNTMASNDDEEESGDEGIPDDVIKLSRQMWNVMGAAENESLEEKFRELVRAQNKDIDIDALIEILKSE
ncbi:hypothetical protein KKF82_09080 [Patescibacteria group bacterium]|nr:hypothetical protein [Patescibacteria group bacterium]